MRATLLVTANELESEELAVDGKTFHHLFRVRRASPDANLRLTDGAGRYRNAKIVKIGKESATLAATGEMAIAPPLCCRGLLVPVLGAKRTTWMVEKSVELGAAAIYFYSGERAPRELTKTAVNRLQRVARSALAQCHGSWLPEITVPAPLSDVLSAVPDTDRKYFADSPGEAALETASGETASGKTASRKVVWAIGPEGGWTDRDRTALLQFGFVPTSLGRQTLRTETAALVALSSCLGR